MKIVELRAENVKRLTAVSIRPDGNLVEITGKNGQGKTSVLDAIWWALAGASNIQAKPIRDGATEARIRIDLGDLIVTRKFTEKGSTIAVESADGGRLASPQTVLDGLAGAVSFDPLSFTKMPPKQQFDTLRALAKVDFDFEKTDQLIAGEYAKRTDVNRQVATEKAQADGINVPADTPDEYVDAQALLKDMGEAADKNAARSREVTRRDDHAFRLKSLHDNLAEAEAKVVQMKTAIAEAEAVTFPALPDLIDTADLQKKIADAQVTNRNVDAKKRKAAMLKNVEKWKADSQALTDSIEARQQAKIAATSKAAMPVPGLSFGEGIVLMDGQPFEQASDAQQLRASVAIAMALNPKLRVIRVRDGSLLDDEALKTLAETAEAQDYQIWIERVDSSGKVGFVIEDGHVKGQVLEPEADAAQPKKRASKKTAGDEPTLV